MKAVLLTLAIFSPPTLWATTKIIGNGGNVQEENPVSVAYLQSLLPDARLFVLSWVQGLDSQMSPDLGLQGANPRSLPIPKGADKLFGANSIYFVFDSVEIVFQTKAPCNSSDGPRDGAVISTYPMRICISGFSLSRKLNEGNAKVQLEALIVHELSHLVATNEDEAVALQQQYLEDMRFVSLESLQHMYQERFPLIRNFAFNGELFQKRKNFDDLCEAIYKFSTQGDDFSTWPEVTPVHFLSAQYRDEALAMDVHLGQVLHGYVCSQTSKPFPPWLSSYESGFAGKDHVTIYDWESNLGLHVNKVKTNYSVVRIVDDNTLLENLNQIQHSAVTIYSNMLYQFMRSFPVQLDESDTGVKGPIS